MNFDCYLDLIHINLEANQLKNIAPQMFKKCLFLSLLMFQNITIWAQSKIEVDKKAINDMCGCYEVSFNFAETFQYSTDSSYVPSETKHSKGLEWVEKVEESDNKFVLQHLLIVGEPGKQRVIKHWRQDWLFQNAELYTYFADNKWQFERLPKHSVLGQWTQKVYQVDDSPRYEGSASWIHSDGKSFWENSADAPLPRREYTKRDDYNVTIRGNRHEITKDGWIHEQDNKKVVRSGSSADFILAEEKGLNIYTKVDDSECVLAQKWWNEHHEFWDEVRAAWEQVFARKTNLALRTKVDGKFFFQHLDELDKTAQRQQIVELIDRFIIPEVPNRP